MRSPHGTDGERWPGPQFSRNGFDCLKLTLLHRQSKATLKTIILLFVFFHRNIRT
jgi:hypothetical protein